MTFDPNQGAKRFNANADAAERNSLMDSGWSSATAANCQLNALLLYRELFEQLLLVPIDPKDFFDRPELAAVLSAVHATKARDQQ